MVSNVLQSAWVKALACCALLAAVSSTSAQTASPEEEYSRYLTPAQTVTPFSSFGDQVSLRNGGLVFRNTDIELPGIGPTIRVTRTMDIVGRIAARPETSGYRFGDWELELPRLKTLVNTNTGVTSDSSVLWQVNALNKNARCTNFTGPGIISFGRNGYDAEPDEWWGGYQLVDASGQSRNVLAPTGTIQGSPAHVAVTSDNWMIGCLPTTSNGQPGEAFLAMAPDGTKYWLDRLVYVAGDRVGANGQPGIDRSYASMLVTRIEDRFGNWVTYQYVTNGISIDASDGRHVGIAFTASGATATVGSGSTARSWQYGVTSGSLTSVTLPDGSSWQYNLSALYSLSRISNRTGNCSTTAPTDGVSGTQSVGTVSSPSGATASYTVGTLHIGRSYIPKDCEPLLIGGDPLVLFAYIPKDSWTYALLSKTVSGPGVTTATWSYSYSPGYSSWDSDCTSGCTSSVWTDVTDPDGTRHRSIFSNKYGETENLLLRQETYASGAGAPMYAVDYTYATFPWASTSSPYPWPVSIGGDYTPRSNDAITDRWTPVLSTTITQDGVTFSSAVNSYDTFARPLSVHKWSSLGYSRNDVTEYYDSISHWVLGQTKRHYNVESGLVDVRNEYDTYTDLPVQTYAFEKLKSTMTYYADGTLATSKDGNNNTTTFSNWYRGIPKNIQFADGTGVSATVDDNGWIRSVTDENGYVTGYGYDAMGRVSGIAYPNETNLTYNATTITFAPSSSAAYGLPAGHWEQVTQTGNRKKIVYFDGLWRPVAEQEEDIGASSATLHWLAKRYDSDGHLVFQSYPINPYVSGWKNFTDALAGITTTYDSLDRVTQVKQNSELGDLTTTTEYLTGFQIRTTNPRNYPTTTGYQVYDQPSYDQLAWSAQPENKDVAIIRNYFGIPISITQSDHANSAISVTRSYIYNANMELCKTIEPEVGSTVMSYDAAGNLAWSAAGGTYPSTTSCNTTEAYSAGRRADRSYDARNRVTFLAFPDGKGNQSWTYTPDGLVASSIVDNDGPGQGSVGQVYTYNHRRLLAGESTSQPGYTMGIGYGYDQNGNLSTQQYPNNLTVSYSPNALGQATSVASTAGKVYASAVSYYPNGGISQFTYGNGIVHTMSQNARQLPASSVDGGIINYGFTYDANGNPTAIADNQRGLTYDRTMTYDGLDRLTGANSGMFGGTDNSHRFTYNALDNITSWKQAGVKDYASYIYDASNRLTNIQNSAGASVVALAYDVQGNLANKNGQAYTFDYGNRLRSAANQESYRYDTQGRRVSQTNPAGRNILSTYAMNGQLMYTNDERRNDALAYIYLSGSQVARVRQATVLPSAPILTAPATNAGGSYALTWSTTATTDSYVLEESANGGAWTTLYNGTSTNAAVSGRAPGSYAYRVKACNTMGCSAYSATSTVQVIAPPSAAPTLTTPTLNTTGSYAVSWTTISGADNYVLEESANGGSSWAQAYSGAGASANIAGKSAGTYTYRVKACNAAGCGGYSATAQTQVMFPPSGVPALTVPDSSYNGAYTATWSSVSTADRYELEESANGGAWTQVYSANGTSLGISGKAAGTYAYRVRACNASGCGGYSNTGQIQVVSAPAAAPSLTVPANSYGGTYAITWTTVATADRYELIESVNGGGWTLAYNSSATNAGFSGRVAGTYAYQARACNAAGCGPYSATGSMQVIYAPGSAPSLSVPAIGYNGSYAVTWSSVATADRYELVESVNGGGWTLAYNSGGTSASFSGRAAGTYAYQVRACNAAGCGPYSATGSLQALYPPGSAPNLSLPANGYNGSYAVTWSSVATADRYELQENANGVGWTLAYNGSGTNTTFTGHSGSYSYQVRACNGAGCGSYSAIGTISVTFAPSTPSISGNAQGDSTIGCDWNVSWTNTGASSYELQQTPSTAIYTGPNTYWSTWTKICASSRTFKVRACNGSNCSAWSNNLTLVPTP